MFIFLVDGYLSQSARLQILRSVVHGGDIPVIVCPNKPAELFAVRFGELPIDMRNAIPGRDMASEPSIGAK
jgi:hypothetical protein